jgi:putative ABC transport system permease protein
VGRVALRMLFGDRAKYLGLVFGVAFATLLIAQQGAIFVSLMQRTASVVYDAGEADIWVMDPAVEYLDGARALRDGQLQRVRSVEGVRWAVPLFKSGASVRTLEGRIDAALLLGVDDASLVGLPRRFVLGGPEDLLRPDAVAIDRAGYAKLWPGEEPRLGRELELNDRRAVVAAITDATAPFGSTPVVYTRYSLALLYVPTGRNTLSFVLARSAPGVDPAAVAAAIEAQTGLRALPSTEFARRTIVWYLANTGIPVNFGAVIILGVIVGAAVVGLTFSMFVSENIKQYAALKAIGLTNRRLVMMVLAQAGVIGNVGYCIGLGLAAAFFQFATAETSDLRGFTLPWWVALGVLGIMFVVILSVTFLSLRRVLSVDPAVVFRG